MPYTQTTLDGLSQQLGILLDDTSGLFWTTPEKYLAIQEGLLLFGGLSAYWRQRGAIPIAAASPSPWIDLSVSLPALRARTWTLGTIVQQIQFALNENAPGGAAGLAGQGMSGQVTISDILNCIQLARQRFIIDCALPLSIHSVFGSPPPPEGLVTFDQSCVYCHRASWQDTYSGVWTNLWREDAWSVDKANPQWTLEPGPPQQFSEAELAPLQLQLSPPPQNTGALEALTVDSLQLDLTDPGVLLGIPDEWVHAVKYAALSQLLGGGGQIIDQLREDYAEQRYLGIVEAARSARSVVRLMVNNVPVPIDSLQALDASTPNWRNQPVDLTLPGTSIGVLYDLLAFPPLIYPVGTTVDVIASCPIPLDPSGFIPLGSEDIQVLVDYCAHVLMFKCGGNEFKSTFSSYDRWIKNAALRNRINQVKIRYLDPLLGQPERESGARPDRMEVASA